MTIRQPQQPRRTDASGKITPFFWFERNAEEAMNYYVDVFNSNPRKKVGAKIVTIQRYPEGIKDGPMAGFDGKVLTGVFELEGQRFMCLDGGAGVFAPSGATSMLVECADQEEIDHFWRKLTEGGDPKAQQCGWLKDTFGFSWQIVPDMGKWMNDTDKEASDRAMQAMLTMKKIDIATLDKAYAGK
jgi:predicted 3-demethylubiquinone-9 3-methyltransferase (glyoxalase superfamily)